MGLFGKVFGKKDDFDKDFSNPPDFSQPPGGAQQDFSQNPYGQDPLQANDPFAASSSPGQDSFSHDIFSTEPTNADRARDYAQGLGAQTQGRYAAPATGQGSSQTYGGAIAGHEAQLILERLDTIKAELDAIKQRMMHVERYMETAEQKSGQRKYF